MKQKACDCDAIEPLAFWHEAHDTWVYNSTGSLARKESLVRILVCLLLFEFCTAYPCRKVPPLGKLESGISGELVVIGFSGQHITPASTPTTEVVRIIIITCYNGCSGEQDYQGPYRSMGSGK